jgi:hypothetical protein
MIVLIVWAHKTSLNSPLFIEMSGQNQDSERYVYLCATLPYFKHILLFNKKQLDRTKVSQLRNVFSNTYMNKYKMNLYNIIYIFHIK